MVSKKRVNPTSVFVYCVLYLKNHLKQKTCVRRVLVLLILYLNITIYLYAMYERIFRVDPEESSNLRQFFLSR